MPCVFSQHEAGVQQYISIMACGIDRVGHFVHRLVKMKQSLFLINNADKSVGSNAKTTFEYLFVSWGNHFIIVSPTMKDKSNKSNVLRSHTSAGNNVQETSDWWKWWLCAMRMRWREIPLWSPLPCWAIIESPNYTTIRKCDGGSMSSARKRGIKVPNPALPGYSSGSIYCTHHLGSWWVLRWLLEVVIERNPAC